MDQIADFVRAALNEDIGRGDLFARCKAPKPAKAVVRSKSEGVFAGAPYAVALANEASLNLNLLVEDGDAIADNQTLIELSGEDIALLQAERTLLNILQHASGVATQTRRFVERLRGGGVTLLDTRKTRPLLRSLEKYAARVGGAVNHRFGLDDCLMIKDTHLATIDDLKAFVANARANIPWTAKIDVECESVETAKIALEAKADIVMCDNMSLADIKRVAALRDELSPSTKIEASGNIALDNIDRYKTLNIDAISSGAPAHHAVWLDFSMKFV
jgi:nicotinate-nucleotide pyrophosphorylase (carboxylating)